MRLRRVALIALCSSSLFLACSELKIAPAVDGDQTDSGDVPVADDGGGREPDADRGEVLPDAGKPPEDFSCKEPWTKAKKTNASCAPRQVRIVDSEEAFLANGVSIARTSAGRVGIVYDSAFDFEDGELRLAHFVPKSEAYTAPKIVKERSEFDRMHFGRRVKVAAVGSDTLRVLSYDFDNDSATGRVVIRNLVGGASLLSAPVDAFTEDIAPESEIALATDPAGNTYAAALISTDRGVAKLSVSKLIPSKPLTSLGNLATDLLTDGAPGVGSASLFVDAAGQLHALFHDSRGGIITQPRYRALAGTTWTSPKTVDNTAHNGQCGFSPSLVTYGTKKYAAYFYRKADQSSADLRIATWESSADRPHTEIILENIPSEGDTTPAYRAAMAIDRYGLLHLAVIAPNALEAGGGYLEYHRQTRDGSGTTKWLSEVIDPDVLSSESRSFVDIVVDDAARPHIAYLSANDRKVKYATRFDR